MPETVFGYLTNDERATVSTDEHKWITRMEKLAETHPDEVTIICEPKSNDGELVAYIPKSWIKIQTPRKIDYSEEQLAVMAARLKTAREKKKSNEVG